LQEILEILIFYTYPIGEPNMFFLSVNDDGFMDLYNDNGLPTLGIFYQEESKKQLCMLILGNHKAK